MADSDTKTDAPAQTPAPAATPPPPAHQRAQPQPPGSQSVPSKLALWFTGPTLNWPDDGDYELRVDAHQNWATAAEIRNLQGTVSLRRRGESDDVIRKSVQFSISEIQER